MTEKTKDLEEKIEDQQILTEVISNERIVEHPKFGKFKFIRPNLDIQKKLDLAIRRKKKELKTTVDEITDPEDPTKVKIVPAFKSREALKKEYEELGWWTSEQDDALSNLTAEYFSYMIELELLGFESPDSSTLKLADYRKILIKLFDADPTSEEFQHIVSATDLYLKDVSENIDYIRTNAPSTDIDTILNDIIKERKNLDIYNKYTACFNNYQTLYSEKLTLFADSWQDQLEYFIRTVQLFYCVLGADTGKLCWKSIAELESEEDREKLSWLFAEMTYFTQGVSDEAREKMEKYSFTVRQVENKKSTEELQDLPKSSVDGSSAENKSVISSAVMATEIPLQMNK